MEMLTDISDMKKIRWGPIKKFDLQMIFVKVNMGGKHKMPLFSLYIHSRQNVFYDLKEECWSGESIGGCQFDLGCFFQGQLEGFD